MRIIPALVLVLLGGCTTPEPNGRTVFEKRLWDWTEAYYATLSASGRDLCGGELYEQRQVDFYRTYGERLRAVLDRHVERFGREETISVQPCLSLRGEAEARHHREATARFVKWLEQAEKDLGTR